MVNSFKLISYDPHPPQTLLQQCWYKIDVYINLYSSGKLLTSFNPGMGNMWWTRVVWNQLLLWLLQWNDLNLTYFYHFLNVLFISINAFVIICNYFYCLFNMNLLSVRFKKNIFYVSHLEEPPRHEHEKKNPKYLLSDCPAVYICIYNESLCWSPFAKFEQAEPWSYWNDKFWAKVFCGHCFLGLPTH